MGRSLFQRRHKQLHLPRFTCLLYFGSMSSPFLRNHQNEIELLLTVYNSPGAGSTQARRNLKNMCSGTFA